VPTTDEDLAAHARGLLDVNRYLTLGTVDADGSPWTTPVYFAPAGERDYYWMSDVDARHSRNLADRPRVVVHVGDRNAVLDVPAALAATPVTGEGHDRVGLGEILKVVLAESPAARGVGRECIRRE